MPSNRKRIGYLPSAEVQFIIEKICKDNKFSQSKVTGILVEEALRSRGVLNNFSSIKKEIGEINNDDRTFSRTSLKGDYVNSNFNNSDLSKDIKMINEFIEYKLFKTIMNKNNNIY